MDFPFAIDRDDVLSTTEDDTRLRRLLDLGRELVSQLDTETLLERILEEAREITGASYAALGVLGEDRGELERFMTAGLDHEATLQAIGEVPHGRGVLGVLVDDPRPLRLADVASHPQSYGFPPGHPPMRSFLGVPIVIRGQGWGNLYLTEKRGGEVFTEADEEAVVLLAQWAAVAIENARLYESSERRRSQLERAVRSLEAARDVTEAIGTVDDLERVLELIVKRGRVLVEAKSILIMLREGEDLVVAASAGLATEVHGLRLPISGSTSGQVLHRGRPERITDVCTRLRIAPQRLGVPDAHTALLVPLIHRGARIGVLAAFDRGTEGGAFTSDDEQLLRTFAQAAANAVAINRSVEAARLRSAIAAADAERGRWARELHDQTLQALGALRMQLGAARRRNEALANEPAISQAIADIELEIGNLRAIISDLRPALLDDLGLLPAIEELLQRRRERGLDIASELTFADPLRDGTELEPELETTVYRLVQEALTNIVKHARATKVHVAIRLSDGQLIVEVKDNGTGFDIAQHTSGFGLAGMRERVYLAGGTLEVSSGPDGTLIRAQLPARRSGEIGSGVDQVA